MSHCDKLAPDASSQLLFCDPSTEVLPVVEAKLNRRHPSPDICRKLLTGSLIAPVIVSDVGVRRMIPQSGATFDNQSI